MQTLTMPASVTKRKQACRGCRQRKKKCDAGHPSCSLCRKWGIVCEYTTGVPRYDRNPPDASYRGSVPAVRPAEPLVFGLGTFDVLSPMPLPSLTFDFSMQDQENSLLKDYVPIPGASVVQGDVLTEFQLPPPALMAELVGLFFDHLYPMYPCFHRVRFASQLEEGTLQNESPLILYAICCVAARYHPDPSVQRRDKDWYAQAKFSYDLTQRDPYPALRTIQAALVLILHAYTAGDFSAGWLFLGKAWRQAVALGMNRMDASNAASLGMQPMDTAAINPNHRSLWKPEGTTAVEKEERRRTLWLMFIMDRNMAWPTAWPNTVSELHFMVDMPVADKDFKMMEPALKTGLRENTPFTRKLERLIANSSIQKEPYNIFQYVCIIHVILGRVSEVVHSLHHAPDSTEYAADCAELDSSIVEFRLSLPRQATSVFDASPTDRAQVIWLQVMLNTCDMILNYRRLRGGADVDARAPFILAVVAARNIAQIIRDASRLSPELLMSAHIGSSLYVAACILVIEWRMTGDDALREEIKLFEMVFDRMNKVFVFLGMKFKFALEYDIRKSKEDLRQLMIRGLRGLLADCSKWTHVKEEVQWRGILIDVT
ncbi:fungal-specific transcription factor domain-containing protein [Paraphoma chrysanthemicola]|nr:fungal-specific transcription factor domain-containing protein [Paraphoma chrysanthemicola]